MRSNPAKENLSRLELKSEAVVHGHRTFPAIYCPGDPFDPKRWVMKIIEKKGKFFLKKEPMGSGLASPLLIYSGAATIDIRRRMRLILLRCLKNCRIQYFLVFS